MLEKQLSIMSFVTSEQKLQYQTTDQAIKPIRTLKQEEIYEYCLKQCSFLTGSIIYPCYAFVFVQAWKTRCSMEPLIF